MTAHHTLPEFSDYIIFADESGSPNLSKIDPDYPFFILMFCIVKKSVYAEHIQPAIKKLKFEFFGHDLTVLHSNDIRKPKGEFSFLLHAERRAYFLERLATIIENADFNLIVHVIDKHRLVTQYTKPFDPYHIALRMCLEQTSLFLKEKKQEGKIVHIMAEGRGSKEDKDLELEFRRIIDPNHNWGMAEKFPLAQIPFELKFVEKKVNSAGLQLADLAGQPIGRSLIKPSQHNTAYEIMKKKIWRQIWTFP